jgi:hypothetical protein
MPDTVSITLLAKTLDGLDAVDPQVTVDITEITPLAQQIVHQIIERFNGAVVIRIPMPDTFPTWQVTVTFSRFDAGAGFFFQPRGEGNPTHTFNVARLPGQWKPTFTSLLSLASPRFDAMKSVVALSNNVDLKTGPAIGDLNTNYDAISGSPQILAKAALLNLYAVLTDDDDPVDGVPWFSHVRKIVRLDQERFIAEVEPALFENVQTIISQLSSTYAAQGFFTEPAADLPLHIPNIPTVYHSDANLVQIITLKKDYEQGNVQLTVSFLRVNGVAVHLLDCDMDENRNIILHSFDLVKHLVDGGTSPVSMHDYIVEDSAQQAANGISTIDLGYVLV